MKSVSIIGVGLTQFDEHWERSFRELIAEAGIKALQDAALEGKDIRHRLFNQRKELIFIRKALLQNKDIIVKLNNDVFKDKKNSDKLYDLQTNIQQQVETAALIQDRLSEIMNLSLTTLSNKLNETMKTFTIFAILLMFPTLIAGIYGMNFRFMPELSWPYGYAFALGLMVLSVLGITFYFRKRKWW